MAVPETDAPQPAGRVDEDAEGLFYLGAGPTAAILLGMALIPLRELTTASNLTFAFLLLTIAVAELGGRWAAVATALTSALSLNFFLTRPYLSLAIHRLDDVLAFVGLAVCGLVAASLASHRNRQLVLLAGSRAELELLRAGLELQDPATLEAALAHFLRVARDVLPLTGGVVRDPRGYVLAASDNNASLRPVPEVEFRPDTLQPQGDAVPRRSPFHLDGGRIPLSFGGRRLGFLDVWGDGAPAGAAARRALSDAARLVALLLASTSPRED